MSYKQYLIFGALPAFLALLCSIGLFFYGAYLIGIDVSYYASPFMLLATIVCTLIASKKKKAKKVFS